MSAPRWPLRPGSLQRLQIRDQDIELVVGQVIVGHERARLDGRRVLEPEANVVRSVLKDAAGKCSPTGEMGQVRPDLALCRGAVDRMTRLAGARLEELGTFGRVCSGGLHSRLRPRIAMLTGGPPSACRCRCWPRGCDAHRRDRLRCHLPIAEYTPPTRLDCK